jgi:hypothetical protein
VNRRHHTHDDASTVTKETARMTSLSHPFEFICHSATALFRRLRAQPRAASAAAGFVALATGLLLLAAPAPASAAGSPAWRISDQAVPGALPAGGSGHLELQVQNIGDLSTDSPVTVVDHLPEGVTATAADGLEYESEGHLNFVPGSWDCSGVGTSTITCVNDPTGYPIFKPSLYNGFGLDNEGCQHLPCQASELAAYHTMPRPIGIAVDISPSAEGALTDLATVSGGGAPASATDHSTIAVNSEPTPFGLAGAHQWAIEADGSPDTQAGSHPYAVSTAVQFNVRPASEEGKGAGALRSVHAELPAGFVGNPDATPKCTQQAFDERLEFGKLYAKCPPDTQVGIATVEPFGSNSYVELPIYNLVPYRGEPARFGIAFNNLTAFLSASVRTGHGYNLAIDVRDIPNQLPISFTDFTFWGVPADPSHDRLRGNSPPSTSDAPLKPFLTLPTQCGHDQQLSIGAEAWEGSFTTGPLAVGPIGFFSSDEENNPIALDGCNKLDFSPTIEAQPTTNVADSPTGFDVDLHIPQNNGACDPAPASCGTAEAHLENTVVALPAGIAVNPSSANGLGACSEAQIELNGPEPAACPTASKVGTVEVDTPLLDHPLPGSVYIAQPFENPFNSLLAIYIAVDDPITGVVVKLPGKVTPDPVTGQLTTTFEDNPQLPFEDFKLGFFGGAGAALRSPVTCGSFTTTTDLTSWASPEVAAATPSSSFQVSHGAGGAACASSEAALPDKPSFTAGTFDPEAGAYSPLALKVSREDGSQPLKGLEFTLPPGLTGKLAGVKECSDAQIAIAESRHNPGEGATEAASPSCPPASEVGTITVGAGAGPTPIYAAGHAYLAGPYKGAPLSVVTITPAIAGPFDLGVVVDRSAAYVNPETAQIRTVTDAIPTILDGIPLDVRSVAVRLDRSDFTLNPTSCDPMTISGAALSTLGQSASLSAPFQVGGCKSLGFAPKLALSLKGSTRHAGHPALKAVLTYPKQGAYANVARAQVNLPHSEFIDQANLNKTCTKPALLAGNCPANSIYGKARAWTPLLDAPLEGPVYLVGGYGYKLPALVAELNGQIRVLLVGKVDSGPNKGIRNTFETVPDAPVEKFVLEMKGGPKHSLLENSEDLCRKPQRAIADFTAQSGRVLDLTPTIATSCKGKGAKAKSQKRSDKHGKKRKAAAKHGKPSAGALELSDPLGRW